MNNEKMKIEVWSDIMCPYCYIGKLHYEKALEEFQHKDKIKLEWKAFQLNPNLPDNGKGILAVDYLKNTANISEENISQMFNQINNLAKECNVTSNLENSIAANSLDAHRLVKYAATKDLDNKVMMLLSKAYFEEAKDYSNHDILKEIGLKAGLNEKEVEDLLKNKNIYFKEVQQDIKEAVDLGFDTVPTFLFNKKHALIGSQPVGMFLKTLQKSYYQWEEEKNTLSENGINITKGKSCSADGTCEI